MSVETKTRNEELVSFDYAIKYLLRDKADHDIIESFLSATFGKVGYSPVKIKSLIESESNKESQLQKLSGADMIVEDENGEKYIVEVERAFSPHFLHKALFNTSRLIVDTIKEGEEYTDIKKVLHITLLFGKTPSMTQSFYHGKTLFRCPGSDDPIKLTLGTKEHMDLVEILPEYFVLVVPNFDNIVHGDLDEWFYMMKNARIYESPKVSCMEKVRTRLNNLTMTPKQRADYIEYRKLMLEMRDIEDGKIIIAEEKGMIAGIEIGKKMAEREVNLKNAKEMLSLNILTFEQISKITGLSIEEIKQLQTQ